MKKIGISFLILSLFAACSHKSTNPRNPALTNSELIRSDYSTGEITKLCDEQISSLKEKLDTFVKTPKKSTYYPASMLLEFETYFADFSDNSSPLTFMGYVSKNRALRDEATACEEKQGVAFVDIFTRKDLYNILKKVRVKDPAEKKLLKETLLGFELNGLKLNDKKLAQVKKLKTELTALETQFQANLNNDTSTVAFSKEELSGVSDDFLNRLKKDDQGNYIVTTKSTDYVELIDNAKNSETRKKIYIAYRNRGGDQNMEILTKALKIRTELANVLGYKTWADYKTVTRMAKNQKNVMQMLNNLKAQLAKRNLADIKKLTNYKKEELKDESDFVVWDAGYVANQIRKNQYQIDKEEIKQYFPSDYVVQQMFTIYSQLLGVNFNKINDPKVWSNDVSLYEIVDKQDNSTVAYFYTDFIPREGKYGHAAAFTLRSGRLLANNEYVKPISAIVANFNPATSGKPSLLDHEQVETLFHEFGHIMHQTLTRAPYASMSGAGVAWDFVEAPSQMLENWVWNKDVLKQISQHYKNNTPLSNELINKMIAAKDFNQGTFYTNQLMLGLFDQAIHSGREIKDVNDVFNKNYKDVTSLDPAPGMHFPSSFGHIMGGYDAGYYGYLWSEVYAQDMFSKFEQKGLLDSETGLRYRHEILEKGKMEEPLVMVENFLGRKSNNKAFLKSLGLNTKNIGH